jgi:hypothetical protein
MASVNVTPGYVWTSGETVTPTKLNSAAAPTATATLADGEVTNAKLASGIDASKLTTGTLPIARIADDAVTDDKLSLTANAGEIKKALNAENDPPIYACRAWVTFNGTRNVTDTGASTNGQPVFIRGSGNVTSVTKNATGSYTVTFATAMPDGNYACTATCRAISSGFGTANMNHATAPQAGSVDIRTIDNSNFFDSLHVSVAIFR